MRGEQNVKDGEWAEANEDDKNYIYTGQGKPPIEST